MTASKVVFALLALWTTRAASLSLRSQDLEDSNQQNDANGKSFAQMMCNDFDPPKNVAVCLHGSARAFPHSLVQQSMKENLFGGSFGVAMTPFLHVVRKDARADPKGDKDVYDDWSEEQLMKAAKALSIPEENIKIMDGPDMPLPVCDAFAADVKKREEYELSKPEHLDHKLTLTYLSGLGGALTHKKGCMDMISKNEQQTGNKFDLVIMSRADLTFYLPLRPYCLYKLDEGRRFWDWFFMVPREMADDLFIQPYEDFYGCKRTLELGTPVEMFVGQSKVKVDHSLSVLVQRKQGAGHSLCPVSFKIENTDFTDVDLADMCHNSLLDENRYNSYMLD